MSATHFGLTLKVAGFDRNDRPACSETGGRLAPKSPADMVRNSQHMEVGAGQQRQADLLEVVALGLVVAPLGERGGVVGANVTEEVGGVVDQALDPDAEGGGDRLGEGVLDGTDGRLVHTVHGLPEPLAGEVVGW